MDVLKNWNRSFVNMILCDPPYGIDYQSNRRAKEFRKDKIKNDKKPFIKFIPYLKNILKTDGCVMIFTRWDVQQQFIDVLTDNRLKVRNILIWNKLNHSMGDLKRAYGSMYESIIFSSENDFRFPGKRPRDIIEEKRVSPNVLEHPNQKPVQLIETLIKQCTHEGDTILDPFMGSGTTGVAAIKNNRNFIGIELDENYFSIAKERIENEFRQSYPTQ